MRALEEGLPRWDMRSPQLAAKQQADEDERRTARLHALREKLAAAAAADESKRAEAAETALLLKENGRVAATVILQEVAAAYGVTMAELLGPRRSVRLVAIRHEAIALIYCARPDMSLPQIGRVVNRDHTAILHAVKKAGVHRSAP